LQFEPERFVDGLLGIGAAGGSSTGSKSNEGAMLAARLANMRKERDERARVKEKDFVAVAAPGPSFPAPIDMQPATSARSPSRTPSNKSKKKKGRK
jgi:hypothetical protein